MIRTVFLRPSASALASCTSRGFATVSPVYSGPKSHRIVVIGGGTAGLNVGHQLLRSGRFSPDDIAVVDPAEWHHYQAGWTLVGGGVKNKEDLRRPLKDLVDPKLGFYTQPVATLSPEENSITLGDGSRLGYEHLIVVPGISTNYDSIKGLRQALADPSGPVSTIFSYDTCDKVFKTVQNLKSGRAIFTQPKGVIKCAGAPQKAMWLALDYWKRAGLYNTESQSSSAIKISFATALPAMFGIPKYSETLEALRKERQVEGLFEHDLVSIDGNTATFNLPDGRHVSRDFDLLHVGPKMEPHKFIRESTLGDESGFVDVDDHTTQHRRYPNVWSIGDASSLPTSRTTAAITSQAPVLVRNLLQSMDGKSLDATYDGYTSCPLITQYGKVLLTEFKYKGETKETFNRFIDQSQPRRSFYYLKRDFFPWVYYFSLVKGTWAGPSGWLR